MLMELTKTILNNYTFQQKIISPVIILMYLTKGEYMKNQTPTQYFFDLIEKELKEYEEKMKRKNNNVPAKNK